MDSILENYISIVFQKDSTKKEKDIAAQGIKEYLNKYLSQQIVVSERPPLGLTPKFIWQEQRLQDIEEAIERYVSAKRYIPVEWLQEYDELVKDIKGSDKLWE